MKNDNITQQSDDSLTIRFIFQRTKQCNIMQKGVVLCTGSKEEMCIGDSWNHRTPSQISMTRHMRFASAGGIFVCEFKVDIRDSLR